MVDHDEAVAAVEFACGEHDRWAKVGLDERRARVSEAVDALGEHHELLALLLVWEIGKPWRLACADVERCIDGVRWYLGQIERQLQTPAGGQRHPLPGPVSNIASWNYPMSVQVHAELVQALAGNAVVAKTPSQGGFHALTLAHALMRRAGLPVTLISGMGSRLGDVLIRSEGLGALVFVGGRANGRRAAVSLADTGRRHMLEQEGLNAWGIWDFSQWELLAQHMRKGFEYAKQRCTAYPRYVVQRRLFPAFLETYLPVLKAVRFGHPLAVTPTIRCPRWTSARSFTRPRPPTWPPSSTRRCAAVAFRCTGVLSATVGSSTCRTHRPTSLLRLYSSRRLPGRFTTPNRSDRWTRSWS
jgi:acyl-CoA reductase-like NAD-dependent aldehyde dehydrogenase